LPDYTFRGFQVGGKLADDHSGADVAAAMCAELNDSRGALRVEPERSPRSQNVRDSGASGALVLAILERSQPLIDL
jgi:hypothetical protein